VNLLASDVAEMTLPEGLRGGVLRNVPVRVLLVFMVLVPWLGLAYRTADRIGHDRSELGFTNRLAPAATRVKLLAHLERQLGVEGGAAALKIAAKNLGVPLEIAESMTGVPIREDLARGRLEVNNALSGLRTTGYRLDGLGVVRARFEAPTMADPYDPGYDELRSQNREALDQSLRELWVLSAQLGSDVELDTNLRALELSVDASRSSTNESNLLLHRSSGSSFDDFGISLIRENHRATLRPLRSIAELGTAPVVTAAKQLLQSEGESTIETETSRPVETTKASLADSLKATRILYPVLAQRNVRLGKISDLAADTVSTRARALVSAQRAGITNTMLWLLASLLATLTIAALVGRAISRPLRHLGRQARSLVDGNDPVRPITPSGPRELVVSALALNDLATTLIAVQQQADALAVGRLDSLEQRDAPPSRLGSSVQLAVRRLSESIQLNKKLRDDFEHAANHDALTGLPNRTAIYRSLEQHLAANETVGLLFVDLDYFKQVNDSQGHHVGDEVLQVMANRFVACAGPNHEVARLGGDEFVIVYTGSLTEGGVLDDLADRLRRTASLPIELGTISLALGASVGLAIAEPTDTASTLLRRADDALYRAKAAGRNHAAAAPAMMDETSFAR
jgi:diguanylate cyclase (GGDEF)-like protein